MRKNILIVGSIITLLLAVFWYLDIITEPLFAVGTCTITLITYFMIPKEKGNNTKITQSHTGNGDNVAGNKTITNGN